MGKKAATELIQKTFNARFNLEQYTLFMRNLLNDYDEQKERDWAQGNYIYQSFREHINRFKRLGIYTDPEGNEVELLVIETKATSKLERARTSLRNFVIKRLNDKNRDYALAAFYSKEDNGADWRFSYIKIEHESYKDQKGKVQTKKELTPAKRFSFLVGEHEHAYTAQKQLLPVLQNDYSNPSITDLESCFSIEKVTDEFFAQYKELYLKLSEHFSTNKSVQRVLSASGIESTRFTKKLLGQIVFLYFLQKKGWLGVPKNEPWGKGDKKFIQSLFEEAERKKEYFFKDYLQFLFYEALAKASTNSPDPAYYKRFDCKIPFLNGGLFEADYDWQNANLSIPNDLFRNTEKNKVGDVGTGVLDVFDRYNFTIKEDEPLEKEVAVDPEMLGKVFENMLEITERKSKGAFYTPREIVHYMCQESLINYLDNAVNDAAQSYQAVDSDQLGIFPGFANKKGQAKLEIEHKGKMVVPLADIETFVRIGFLATENDQVIIEKGKETSSYKFQLPETVRTHADELDKHLTSIKICDPAIGSGAFPVGLLHELVTAQKVLLPYLSEKYLSEKLKTIDLEKAEYKKDPTKYVYRVKRHAIQESIYGVDIDASAIDIARLRLWLSLIVDEDDFYSIEALPNLDYKIVKGSSLIGLPENAMKDLNAEAELEKLKDLFFNETKEADKKRLRTKINNKIRQLLDHAEQFAGYKIDFDFKLYFSEVWHYKKGFDIVIGNPPYGASVNKKDSPEYYKIYQEILAGEIETYILFYYTGFKILNKPNGVLEFITPDSWLTNRSASLFRNWLSRTCEIVDVFDHYKPFPNAKDTRVHSVLLAFPGKHQVVNINQVHPSNRLNIYRSYKVKQNIIKSFAEKQWRLYIKDEERKLFDIMENKSKPLVELFNIKYGLRTGDNKKYVDNNKGILPLIGGSDIAELYKIKWKPKFLRQTESLPESYFNENFTKEKIIVQYVRTNSLNLNARWLEAALNIGDHIPLNSLSYIFKKGEKYKIKYCLALINSFLMNRYYRAYYTDVNVKPSYLSELPIPDIEDVKQSYYEALVDYVIFSKEINENFIASYFSLLIDAMVFELYFEDAIHLANKHISKHIGKLVPIDNNMSKEKRLSIIQSEFNRLYDPNHPIRNNIETLGSVEEVRIIKETLK